MLSGLFGLTELTSSEDPVGWVDLTVATVFAFIFGYISIAFLLRYLAHHSMMIFVHYRLILGVVVIALAARSLPAAQQKKAVAWGSGAAVVMRIVLTIVAVEPRPASRMARWASK